MWEQKKALCTPTLEEGNPTNKHLELYTRYQFSQLPESPQSHHPVHLNSDSLFLQAADFLSLFELPSH